jgi:hypothetical protein
MFVSKARTLPYSGAPERGFTWIGSGPTRKHFTRLERPVSNKHSSLLVIFVSYGEKSVENTAPGASIIKHFGLVNYGKWTYFVAT